MDDFPSRGPGDGPGWGYMHDGVGWVGWLFMGLFLLFLVALVVGVVWLLLRSTRGAGASGGAPGPATGGSSAEQVLDERYARGEIEEDEYLRRRSVLRGS
jgi:putative membrane protein